MSTSPKPESPVRVLVVDDNRATVTATVKYLQLGGYAVRGALSGAQALAEASTWSPRVVVLDLGLPDIDGFSVCERLKHDFAHEPMTVIAISGRSDETTQERAREAGFSAFLVKPVGLERLKALVGETSGERLPNVD